ncbi:hypothetical protein ACH40F_52630 [Streptomyces sp. NPDC020794]|uniref:hypothetical protein n=1 Tax=unclassified Streptomyces TaxID=2593676 RepID=UPI0036E61CCA
MANVVWHAKLRIFLDLTKDDLDHPEYEDLWSTVYAMDRMPAAWALWGTSSKRIG